VSGLPSGGTAKGGAEGDTAGTGRPSRLRVVVRLLPALVVVALALAGPLLAPHGADEPITGPYALPEPGAPLGGDQLGRDVLSRLLTGGRDLLAASAVVAVAVTAIAALLGALSAVRPAVGALVERAADTLILLPAVLGIMVIGVSWPGAGRLPVVVAAIVLGTPFAFRVAAAAAAPVAASGFVEVASAGGERALSLVCREILPNLRITLLALLGLRFVDAVYVVATAGFLEVGAQPPAADWALMIRENAGGILLNPWGVVMPSIAIAVLAVSVNLACHVLAPPSRTRTVTRL
jgi:peptide/nickel transport system permease protein